jgi:hypothetical protein
MLRWNGRGLRQAVEKCQKTERPQPGKLEPFTSGAAGKANLDQKTPVATGQVALRAASVNLDGS